MLLPNQPEPSESDVSFSEYGSGLGGLTSSSFRSFSACSSQLAPKTNHQIRSENERMLSELDNLLDAAQSVTSSSFYAGGSCTSARTSRLGARSAPMSARTSQLGGGGSSVSCSPRLRGEKLNVSNQLLSKGTDLLMDVEDLLHQAEDLMSYASSVASDARPIEEKLPARGVHQTFTSPRSWQSGSPSRAGRSGMPDLRKIMVDSSEVASAWSEDVDQRLSRDTPAAVIDLGASAVRPLDVHQEPRVRHDGECWHAKESAPAPSRGRKASMGCSAGRRPWARAKASWVWSCLQAAVRS